MAIDPDVQVVAQLNSVLGDTEGPLPAREAIVGSVTVQLCGYGSQVPRVPTNGMIARITDSPDITPEGYFDVLLFNNTLIEPEGTYYTFTITDDNGDIAQVNAYRFTQPGYYDLSMQVPYDPNQPPPPLPPLVTNQLLVVPSSATPDFPGDTLTTFRFTLTEDVTSSTATGMIQGNLYTFILFQDAVGGHAFTWPPITMNASPINPDPSGLTIQTFVMGLTYLVPIGAATW